MKGDRPPGRLACGLGSFPEGGAGLMDERSGTLAWHGAACPGQDVRAAVTCAVSSELRTKHTLPSRNFQ